MLCANECHVRLIPQNETELIKLVRHENIVYKFTIKNGKELQRLIKQYSEETIQQKLQDTIIYVIKMKEEGPAEVQLSTSLFIAKIDIYAWNLSTKIYFQNTIDKMKYVASAQQYAVIIKDRMSSTRESDQNLDPSKKLDLQLEEKALHHLKNHTSVNRTTCFLNSDAKHDRMSEEFSSIIQEFPSDENTGSQRAFTTLNSTENAQNGIMDDACTSKAEEERLTNFLDAKGLNASKLLKKRSKKNEGIFTRVFRYKL